MNILPRTLEEMTNRPTRYEVELIIDGKSRIVGYTASKTTEALQNYVAKHRDEIAPHLGDLESVWVNHRPGAIEINDNVSVRFTGRTERDARMAMLRAAA